MASLKQRVKDLASEIKGEDENFEITLFQSGDELEIPPTDNFEGKSGGTGPSNVTGQPNQGGEGGGDDGGDRRRWGWRGRRGLQRDGDGGGCRVE